MNHEEKNEKYDQFVHSFMLPEYSRADKMMDISASFSRLIYQAVFSLNAGGLVALYAIRNDSPINVLSPILFLISIFLCGLSVYTVYQNFLAQNYEIKESANIRLQYKLNDIYNKSLDEAEIENIKERQKKLIKRINFTFKWAIQLVFASVSCLLLGVIFILFPI